jgi:hypothetical protein
VQDISGDPRLASPAVANQASWGLTSPSSPDYEARLSLRMPVVNTDYTVSCYIRPSADLTNRFELKFNMSAETITLVRRDVSVETSLGLSTAFDFIANQRVHVRIWAVGTNIKARWWRDLDPEPLTWNYDITVSQHLTNARFGVAVRAGALASSRTVYMSDFLLRDAPTSNPPPTPLGSTQAFGSCSTAADVGFTNQTVTVAPTSGVLRNTTISTDAVAYYTYDTLSTDHYSSADLVIGSSGTGVSAGLTARHSTGASTYYLPGVLATPMARELGVAVPTVHLFTQDRAAVKAALEKFIAEKEAAKKDPEANSGYYIKTARTYLQEIGNEAAIKERMAAIEDEIYRLNQPRSYAYSLVEQKEPTKQP